MNATTTTEQLIRAYYDAFNRGDSAGFLALLAEDVIHDISQGEREIGRERFAQFIDHMNRCYHERVADLVIMTAPGGRRAATEYTIHGTYLATDPGVPRGTAPACGQGYTFPAGAFFEIRDGKIARVSVHYNLGDWIAQVNEGAVL